MDGFRVLSPRFEVSVSVAPTWAVLHIQEIQEIQFSFQHNTMLGIHSDSHIDVYNCYGPHTNKQKLHTFTDYIHLITKTYPTYTQKIVKSPNPNKLILTHDKLAR